MSQETFPLTLGGRRWELPHFRWGVIRKLQPRLLRFSAAFAGLDDASANRRLDEAALEELTGILALAIREIDPNVETDTLDQLPIRPAELFQALPAVMQACGLVLATAAEGAPDPKA
jgi:hypothetical protein